jgi:hypothetical protein
MLSIFRFALWFSANMAPSLTPSSTKKIELGVHFVTHNQEALFDKMQDTEVDQSPGTMREALRSILGEGTVARREGRAPSLADFLVLLQGPAFARSCEDFCQTLAAFGIVGECILMWVSFVVQLIEGYSGNVLTAEETYVAIDDDSSSWGWKAEAS